MPENLTYPNGTIKAKYLKRLGGECPCKYPSDKYTIQNGNVYENVDAFGNN